MAPRRPASGKPKLQPLLEAQLVVAASRMGLSGSDALGDAARRWITWSEKELPRRAYTAAVEAFEAGCGPSPMAQDYGLPPDFGIPRGPQ